MRRLATLIGAAVLIVSCAGDDAAPPTTTTTPATTAPTTPATTAPTTPATSAPATTTTTLPPVPLRPDGVFCSSELAAYPCAALIDGDPDTRWNGTAGGIGTTIDVVFRLPVRLTAIVFTNVAEEEPFLRNARISSVQVSTDDGVGAEPFRLEDAATTQEFDLPTAATTRIRLVITDAYPGESVSQRPPFAELALAEIGFVGYRSAPPDSAGRSATTRPAAGGLSLLADIAPDLQGRIDALAFDGEAFLALARLQSGEATMWKSADGIGWERISTIGWFDPEDGPLRLVPADEGGVVAAGSHFGSAAVWWSENGSAWTEIRLEVGAIVDVAATPIGLVAVGTTGAGGPAAWRSEDGSRWETTIRGDLDGAAFPLRHVAASSEILVAMGAGPIGSAPTVVTSLDGRVWRVAPPRELAAVTGIADLGAGDGTVTLLEPEPAALWTAAPAALSTDGSGPAWSATPLRWLLAPAERHVTALTFTVVGDRLVLVGSSVPPIPEEDDQPRPEAWIRDEDGAWSAFRRPGPGDGRTPTTPTAVAAGRGRIVIAVATADERLSVWVLQPV